MTNTPQGTELFGKVQAAKLLVVGAGGIGECDGLVAGGIFLVDAAASSNLAVMKPISPGKFITKCVVYFANIT